MAIFLFYGKKIKKGGCLVFYYLLALFLVSIVLVKLIIKESKKKKDGTKKMYETRREWINRLHEIERFDVNGYSGETKKEIENLIEKAVALTEEIFKLKDEEEQFEDVKKRYFDFLAQEEAFSKKLQESIKDWDSVQKEIEETIEYATEFFVGTNFFPPEFINDTHRLERMLSEIKEEKRQNPLSSSENYKKENKNLRENIETFKTYHQRTAELIEKVDKKKDSMTKKQYENILNQKQELFIFLQAGKFDKVKKKLIEIEKKVK